MKMVKLTVEDFIIRSIEGERFRMLGRQAVYHYDTFFTNPFRVGGNAMESAWGNIDGTNEFEVVGEDVVKKVAERRWRWLKDVEDGLTQVSNYVSDCRAKSDTIQEDGWRKSKEFIDVMVTKC